jgi:hypothetical protein
MLAQVLNDTVEVLAVDVDGRRMTVLDAHGDEYTVPVNRKAVYGLVNVRSGDRVELSWGPENEVVYIAVR